MGKKYKNEDLQVLMESGDLRIVCGSMSNANSDEIEHAKRCNLADHDANFYAIEYKQGPLWMRERQIGWSGLFGCVLTTLDDVSQEMWDEAEKLPEFPSQWFAGWKPKEDG